MSKLQKTNCCLFILLPVLLLIGCGGGPDGIVIDGQVTVDGETLSDGSIVLSPVDAGIKTATTIENGAFKFEPRDHVQPVEYQVEIYESNPNQIALDDVQAFDQFANENPRASVDGNQIAPEFNRRTQLKINASEKTTHSFEVKRQKGN